MQTLPSATSAEKVPALPESWAEQIFRRLENFYGAKFADSLGGIARERVKRAWSEELAEYAAEESSAASKRAAAAPGRQRCRNS